MNIDNKIIILERYNLTPNELHCVELILLAAEENSTEQLIRFCSISDEHKNLFRNCLISLQDKGIILKSYIIPASGEQFLPENVEFNKNFIKQFYRSSFEMGQELFNIYPMFGEINGVAVPIKGVANRFNSLEDFYSFYGKTIKYNPELHNKIIDLVNWAKTNTNFMNQAISNFVINNGWLALEELRNSETTSNVRIL